MPPLDFTAWWNLLGALTGAAAGLGAVWLGVALAQRFVNRRTRRG